MKKSTKIILIALLGCVALFLIGVVPGEKKHALKKIVPLGEVSIKKEKWDAIEDTVWMVYEDHRYAAASIDVIISHILALPGDYVILWEGMLSKEDGDRFVELLETAPEAGDIEIIDERNGIRFQGENASLIRYAISDSSQTDLESIMKWGEESKSSFNLGDGMPLWEMRENISFKEKCREVMKDSKAYQRLQKSIDLDCKFENEFLSAIKNHKKRPHRVICKIGAAHWRMSIGFFEQKFAVIEHWNIGVENPEKLYETSYDPRRIGFTRYLVASPGMYESIP